MDTLLDDKWMGYEETDASLILQYNRRFVGTSRCRAECSAAAGNGLVSHLHVTFHLV